MDFSILIQGTAPLLMHSARLSNPLDPAAKALKAATSKRTKTEDDYERVAELEHAGGMYWDPTAGPYMPADNIWRALLDAAKKTKRGPKVKEGVFITTDINPIAYEGPRTIEGLWKDKNFVHLHSAKVTTQRVIRCRPMFKEWVVEADGIIDDGLLDFNDLVSIAKTAGDIIGLGDWRPRYGRFIATVTKR